VIYSTLTTRVKQNVFVGVRLGLVVGWDVAKDPEPMFFPKLVDHVTGNEIPGVAPEPGDL
jgi:hypothetical protein